MRVFIHLISTCFFVLSSWIAHARVNPPKREFRAAWIATVSNIDWPSKQGLPSSQQQAEFIARLDQLKGIGCNAAIVQVRPSADAFYNSDIEPWSHYLTGRQGEPPFPYYDPLKFMIEEAHKRHIELHAWINPFRALTQSTKNPNPASHVTKQHPDWIVHYADGKSYINPGIPEARDYVIKVVIDIVKRYDIDAIHMDDYFYPYRVGRAEFPDGRAFAQYPAGFTNKAEWRRNNVNLFVSVLHTAIRNAKPQMKFGISPFGIEKTNLNELYADVGLWLEKGWIDYVLPQLYWEHGHRVAPFEDLMPWWVTHTHGRHVYFGLGLYRMVGAKSGPWAACDELLSQISDIRTTARESGFSLYSISNFDKITKPVYDSLQQNYDRTIALMPVMKWLDSIPPAQPQSLKHTQSGQGIQLKWSIPEGAKNDVVRYVIYRFDAKEKIDLERADKIISLESRPEFLDRQAARYPRATYVVTALDRMWNESRPALVSTMGE